MEPVVTSRADGVEPLGGGPAEASTPSPAFNLALFQKINKLVGAGNQHPINLMHQ